MRMGTPRSLHSWATSLIWSGLLDVAGIEAQALHAGVEGGQRHPVLVVDVGDDRHGRAGHDAGQSLGRLLLVAGAAHDVGAGAGECVDLGERAVDIGGLGRRHRLDRDRCTATDRHVADTDLAGDVPLVRRHHTITRKRA